MHLFGTCFQACFEPSFAILFIQLNKITLDIFVLLQVQSSSDFRDFFFVFILFAVWQRRLVSWFDEAAKAMCVMSLVEKSFKVTA
jgi:hypothetical protein